jgi:hypothetical protein
MTLPVFLSMSVSAGGLLLYQQYQCPCYTHRQEDALIRLLSMYPAAAGFSSHPSIFSLRRQPGVIRCQQR